VPLKIYSSSLIELHKREEREPTVTPAERQRKEISFLNTRRVKNYTTEYILSEAIKFLGDY
jgi:hypothetical protein